MLVIGRKIMPHLVAAVLLNDLLSLVLGPGESRRQT